MTKKQHYMTKDERYKMEALLEAKIPVGQIAKQLGFCRQTIYNEIERGAYVHTCEWWDEVRYSADKGQQIHEYNQTAKGRPLKIGNNRKLADFLEEKMLGVQEDGSIDKRKRYYTVTGIKALPDIFGQTLLLVGLKAECRIVLRSVGADRRQDVHIEVRALLSFSRLKLAFCPAKKHIAGIAGVYDELTHLGSSFLASCAYNKTAGPVDPAVQLQYKTCQYSKCQIRACQTLPNRI